LLPGYQNLPPYTRVTVYKDHTTRRGYLLLTTIDDILDEEDIHTLTPIACKFCESRYVTYIELDFILHLCEAHGIGRGYLDTPPTPSSPSSSWSDDYRIRNAINEGKELGHELEDSSIERLDVEYSKYLDSDKTPIDKKSQASITVGMQEVKSWSQRVKNSFTFMPITSVDEFFKDDPKKPYSALRNHSLEQSPCYPIIGVRSGGRHALFYCEICSPEFGMGVSIHLGSIEHHCKYRDPERHRSEILSRVEDSLR
jgi:hypothetical protein